MEGLLVPIGAGLALIFVIWLLVKITKAIKPMSKEEMIQHEINKRAAGSDEERARALGETASKASKGGCLGKLLLLAIIIVVLLWLFSNFQK